MLSQEAAERPSAIESTYKAREVEGIVDLYFYRRVGFRLAQVFARLNFTPTTVTLIGGAFGIIAGHLYFYQSVAINLFGMVFHIVANVFDNADGQLARLTNQRSQMGRILDPVVDHLVFVSIYAHIALRLNLHGFSAWIWVLALAAGVSHGWQAAAADYCRNAYLYFAKGRNEFDSVAELKREYRHTRWDRDPWRKFLLALYMNVMREQEFLLPGVRQLQGQVRQTFGSEVPAGFRSRYCDLLRPTFRWWGFLMTNTRMLILFVLFLVRQPVWFFWIELTLGNVLLLYLILRQEKLMRSLSRLLVNQTEPA